MGEFLRSNLWVKQGLSYLRWQPLVVAVYQLIQYGKTGCAAPYFPVLNQLAQGTILLVILGSQPAWGQVEARANVSPTPSPQVLAQASSQQFNQMLFVNPVTGDDQRGEGSLRSPFRSITHALQFAESGTIIVLSAGTYDARSGEQFPIVLPPGVRLQEDPTAERGQVAIAGAVTQGNQPTAQRPVVPSQPTPPRQAPPPAAEPVVTVPRSTPSARPSAEAIPIPVPPPATRQPTPPTPRPPVTASVPPQTRLAPGVAIEIPVPPPENPMPVVRQPRPTPPANIPTINLAIQPPVAPSSSYNILPVPDPNAPLGYTGDLPRVTIPNSVRTTNVSQGAGGTVSRGAGGLRYRVLVRADNERVRNWVRSVAPGAFETEADGETMMQIGAFQSLENAEEAAEQLSRNGVRAIIEEWR